jgi:hypothetical protein
MIVAVPGLQPQAETLDRQQAVIEEFLFLKRLATPPESRAFFKHPTSPAS